MKRAMKVENSVVVNTVETLPTGVKVLTIDYFGDYEKIPSDTVRGRYMSLWME